MVSEASPTGTSDDPGDPFRADRRARAMNTKLLPRCRIQGVPRRSARAEGRNLWSSKPVDEEWRRNTYFIHIHSTIRGWERRRNRGWARVNLVKLFIGERWPIHVAPARMRGMSSSVESKPRYWTLRCLRCHGVYRFPARSPRRPRGYRDFLPVIYFAIITTPRVRYPWLLNARPWGFSRFLLFILYALQCPATRTTRSLQACGLAANVLAERNPRSMIELFMLNFHHSPSTIL